MKITVNRSRNLVKGTFWRPVEHTVHQRQTIELVRRETPEGQPDKIIRRDTNVSLSELDLLLAGARNTYTPARIEDVYNAGEYHEGFVYISALGAFVHEDEVERVEENAGAISPGVIIAKAARIDEGVRLSPYVELEKGVTVGTSASIGERTVLRKGSRVGNGAEIGSLAYVGQFSRIGNRAVVGSMSVVDKEVFIGADAQIGRQGRVGAGSSLLRDSWLDDSVHIGSRVHVGKAVSIGEMTSVGDRSHIGDGAMVGAESRLGRFVRVAKGVILASPTEARDGELILQSNLFVPRTSEQ